jgi:hypothetical protein
MRAHLTGCPACGEDHDSLAALLSHASTVESRPCRSRSGTSERI